jgi:hypothetical protein
MRFKIFWPDNNIIDINQTIFPGVLVKKKNGEFRFAIDYRKLNAVTQPITYPLPRLDDVFDAIGQANAWFINAWKLWHALLSP